MMTTASSNRWALANVFSVNDFDLLARMTLLLLVMYNDSYLFSDSSEAQFSLFVLTIAVLGLIFQGLLRSERYWFIVAAAQGAWIVMQYNTMDNHKYLLAYWLMAFWLAVRASESETMEILRWNARILLGLAMAWAVVWKGVLTPEYLDSSFFHMTILTDPRLEHVVGFFGAIGPEVIQQNQDTMAVLGQSVRNGTPVREVVLASSNGIAALAHFVTYSTLMLEAGLAALMFTPGWGSTLTWLRHSALIAFLVTTYWAVPVVGFGWLLIIMGLALCPPSFRALRVAYVVLFLALQLRLFLI